MSNSAQMKRLAMLEARRRPVVDKRTKAERDDAVRSVLADPERVAAISARLLGCGLEGDLRARPIIVGLRADA